MAGEPRGLVNGSRVDQVSGLFVYVASFNRLDPVQEDICQSGEPAMPPAWLYSQSRNCVRVWIENLVRHRLAALRARGTQVIVRLAE
jgi:hypothetical protein